ncbi:hypothetical protein DL770_004293 [Monosporascus sp. CRB-9-2]|nr:hypothetical protein DL770_004293 [Monosporascus sp. CRB-9-2]
MLQDKVQKLVTWLEKFKAIGDVVASYDPAHMALPWAGIRFLIQATAAQGKQMEDLLVGLETITYLVNRFRVYEVLYLGTEQPQTQAKDNLTQAVVAVYTAILRFLASATNGYQNGITTQALQATIAEVPNLFCGAAYDSFATSRRDNGVIHTSLRRLYQKYITSAFATQSISTEDVKRELISLANTFKITTIVIDALDECHLDARSNPIEALAEIATESARPVRVLMSARPDGDLRYYMSSEASVDLTLVDTRDDISKFVTESVYGRPKDAPNLRFQWAKLQIAQLRKLQSERDIRRRLGQFPEKLQDLYHEIRTQIQSQEGDKPMIARRAFQILLSAFAPMSPPELTFAVCQDPDTDYVQDPYVDIDYILDSCQNLLLVDQHENACRLSHLSVYEYFQAHELGISSSHSLMAEVCLLLVTDTDIGDFPVSDINLLTGEVEITDVLETAPRELAGPTWDCTLSSVMHTFISRAMHRPALRRMGPVVA